MNSNVNRTKNIVISGLNQIYSSTIEEISSIDQINTMFIKNLLEFSELSDKSTEKIKNIINKFNNSYNTSKFDIVKYKLDLETYIRVEVKVKEFDIIELLRLNNYFSLEKNFLQTYTNQNIYLLINNANPLFLYYEYVILGFFNISDIIVFQLEQDLKKEVSLHPYHYIVCSHELEYLYEFHKLNCWTIYLTSFVYNSRFINQDFDLNIITENNKKFIKKYGKFYCMATGNIIQIEFYIKEMFKKISSEDNSSTIPNIQKLTQIFNINLDKMNPIKVLYLHMIIFKKNELQKAHHYTSNDKIIFLPYIGFDEYDEINLNSDDFDLILLKFSTQQEYDFLKKLMKSLEKYADEKLNKKGKKIQFINSLKPMESFYHRYQMSIYLDAFCQSQDIKKINESFKTKTTFPNFHSVNLSEISEESQFLSFLKSKNIKLPIIIKHSGPVEFGHLLACIISYEGLKNYHSYIKNLAEPYNQQDIDLVIQLFNNHDGYFIKLFYINDKAYSYIRPSIPNLFESLKDTEDRFEKGFYPLVTDDLLTQHYLEFW